MTFSRCKPRFFSPRKDWSSLRSFSGLSPLHLSRHPLPSAFAMLAFSPICQHIACCTSILSMRERYVADNQSTSIRGGPRYILTYPPSVGMLRVHTPRYTSPYRWGCLQMDTTFAQAAASAGCSSCIAQIQREVRAMIEMPDIGRKMEQMYLNIRKIHDWRGIARTG